MSNKNEIQAGKIVELAYVLKNSKGETVDQAGSDDPFPYLHGHSQIVPGLEDSLVGLSAGAKKTITVPPEQGYGDKEPGLLLKLTREQFPTEAEVKVGMQFEATNNHGDSHVFSVTEINGEEIVVDGNHPMAGETLRFEVEVLSVRDATAEELEHGHAHHGDGHTH